MIILDGREVARKIRLELKKDVVELKEKGIKPKLVTILVGDNKVSQIYMKNKEKSCEEIGIDYENYILPKEITMYDLLKQIDILNNRDDVHGIILQSPVPNHLDINKAFEYILNQVKM